MPRIACPLPNCDYTTDDVEPVLAAALLNIHSSAHAGGERSHSGSSARPPPIERPKLQAGCPRADWEVFSAKWRSFKLAANITSDKVIHQLLGCLDNDLGALVYNEHAAPETLKESELLDLIKQVAVKPENVWVTREKLHAMKQDNSEPVSSFAARLRGQARLCGFQAVKCCEKPGCGHENTFDFTDQVVMGDLVRGLSDPEIKS